MSAAAFAIAGDFSVSELLREAAEHALSINHRVEPGPMIDTPVMTGLLRAEEVQPGLLMSTYDITYLQDSDLTVEMEPSLLCGLLLGGESRPMEVRGHGPVHHAVGRMDVIGFGSRTTCGRPWVGGQRARAFGLSVLPGFLEKYANDVAGDTLAPLHAFLEPGFHHVTLPRLPKADEIANEVLRHTYSGSLARLFHESQSLRFLVETAIGLRDRERLTQRIGRLAYERAHAARDILDRSLVDPPKALDLARQVGVNLTTLQANFKAAFGTTLFGYVRIQRLKMGRVLMIDHDLRVAEAGRSVGFSSPAAFTAAYRKHFGHPPTVEQGRRSRS